MSIAAKKSHAHAHEGTHAHVTHEKKKSREFVTKVIGYDGVNDGLRPLRMSVILATLLSVLVVSIITYFVGGNY
ncbi:hypothetical protein KBD45_05840 [Candidatus Dojkabacteria bacterium]|nr:hypothetical protein [Candidatus Dojkabacteria bacterium]